MNIPVYKEPNTGEAILCQTGGDASAFTRLCAQYKLYLGERAEGHTRQFLENAIFTLTNSPVTSNPFLGFVVQSKPLFPASLYQPYPPSDGTTKSVAQTNSESYMLVDGDIAWIFHVSIFGQARPQGIYNRIDANEVNPKYSKVYADVEREVYKVMQDTASLPIKNRTLFLDNFTKEKLLAHGIAWRSRSELNPDNFVGILGQPSWPPGWKPRW